MIRNRIINTVSKLHRNFYPISHYSSNAVNLDKLEAETATTEALEEDVAEREREIEKKRNKSRLNPHHRRIVHNQRPFDEPVHWSHGTLRYHRIMYGRYGESSGVDPALCWPIKEELNDRIIYESVKYPYTIPEMIETARKAKQEKHDALWASQRKMQEKMKQLDRMKREILEKAEKKMEEARAAKERKDKLIEEVRRHFGYTVDPRDEKFKELLLQKEKEQKKIAKEARKKLKEEQMIKKLLSKNEEKPKENKIQENKVNSEDKNT